MEDVEERALRDLSTPLRFWKRYVDDICAAVPRTQVDILLAHINTIEPSIKFTLERENEDGCLPFLDVLLHHNSNGTLSTTVYRKPTHTDKYLNIDSHHPLLHKVEVVRTLVSRANDMCSSNFAQSPFLCVEMRREKSLGDLYKHVSDMLNINLALRGGGDWAYDTWHMT